MSEGAFVYLVVVAVLAKEGRGNRLKRRCLCLVRYAENMENTETFLIGKGEKSLKILNF